MTHHLYPFSDERSYFFGPLHDHNRLCHGSKTFFRKPDKDKRFFTVFVVKNTSFAAISCRKLSGGGVLTVQHSSDESCNSFIQPQDYPELRQRDSYKLQSPSSCPMFRPIYWTFLTRYIMPSIPVSQHKLCGHARLASCEKFQPFWDCFNDLFIKPITKPEEWQTCPHSPHSPPQSRFASPISPTK